MFSSWSSGGAGLTMTTQSAGAGIFGSKPMSSAADLAATGEINWGGGGPLGFSSPAPGKINLRLHPLNKYALSTANPFGAQPKSAQQPSWMMSNGNTASTMHPQPTQQSSIGAPDWNPFLS